MVAPTPSGYSADVRLQLKIGDATFELAQIGGGRIRLTHETVVPGTTGEIIAHIDHHEQRWQATWQPSPLPRKTIDVQFLDHPTPIK